MQKIKFADMFSGSCRFPVGSRECLPRVCTEQKVSFWTCNDGFKQQVLLVFLEAVLWIYVVPQLHANFKPEGSDSNSHARRWIAASRGGSEETLSSEFEEGF